MTPEGIGMTLTQYILEGQRVHPEATGRFTAILNQIALAAKVISREVNMAGLVDILGLTGETNVQGEQVRKLDRYAHDVFVTALGRLGQFCVMVSEEADEPILVPPQYGRGRYTIVFDPLDGSSNIDANITVGSIFAIHHKRSPGETCSLDDLLQPGRDIEAARYVMYGSSTLMVLSTGHGVCGFTLDPTVGEFLVSHPDIRIPERGTIYSTNEGNYCYWSPEVRAYIDHLKKPDAIAGHPYSARYAGSMVGDVHRTLLYGGIFLYPADTKDPRRPEGKLRLLYECAPMAFIAEQAGGSATTGRMPVLDVRPEDIHQRCPFFVGSPDDVEELLSFLRPAQTEAVAAADRS